jgi:hypothetical protein
MLVLQRAHIEGAFCSSAVRPRCPIESIVAVTHHRRRRRRRARRDKAA